MIVSKYLLLFTFCFISALGYAAPPYAQLASKIRRDCSRDLKKQGLLLVGSGGEMPYDVKKIFACYMGIKSLNVEQARNLFVEVTEHYLDRVNSDVKIRPFLHNFPFKYDNMEIMIYFEGKRGAYPDTDKVALVFLNDRTKNIMYEGYDHESDRFYSLYKEPYEEAFKIVHGLSKISDP